MQVVRNVLSCRKFDARVEKGEETLNAFKGSTMDIKVDCLNIISSLHDEGLKSTWFMLNSG